MQECIRQFRLFLFTALMQIAIRFLPKDAIKTYQWLTEMPLED